MNALTDRVLAVDIGTSSVRAMVFDAAGHVAARSQIAYPTIRPAPYFEEQYPDLVRTEVYRAMALCLRDPNAEPARIAAISFSSQAYSILALDEGGRATTGCILWSDGRSAPQAAAMKESRGALWLYPETGCPMNSIYPLAKLVWLREVRPEVFYSARRFVSIKEYVTEPLIGEWAVDYSIASSSGLFNIRSNRWHTEALGAAGVSEARLSRPVSGMEGFALRPNSSLAGCGLHSGVRVFLGGADGPLANLGSGASAVGTVNIDLGTSGAARCIVPEATTDDTASLWCFCLTDKLWTYGGIVTNVGNAFQWLGAELWGASESGVYERMNRMATEAGPGAGGLYFMPYLRKVRSPYWDDRLKGTIYGLTADHGAAHIVRALFEAIAYDLRTILDIMKQRTTVAPYVLLTGGVSQSAVIPQLLADVLNCELRVPENSEGSIAGAAILALRGLDMIDGLAFSGRPPCYRSFIPDAALCAKYNRMYKGYLRLVESLRSIDLGEEVCYEGPGYF